MANELVFLVCHLNTPIQQNNFQHFQSTISRTVSKLCYSNQIHFYIIKLLKQPMPYRTTSYYKVDSKTLSSSEASFYF